MGRSVLGDAEIARFGVRIDVVIRSARQDDLKYLESWPGFNTPAHRQALRYYLAEHRRGGGVFLVADAGGHPIGQLFLWYRREDPQLGDGEETVSLTALRVWTPFRRRGVATRLAAAAEGVAREAGFRTITIGTDVDNEAAHRLYRSWGYEEFKRSTYQWDGKVYPQICMRKRLSAGGQGPAAGVGGSARPMGDERR
jgi:ribosomal protein S18 acetylase RimI-like enzyme